MANSDPPEPLNEEMGVRGSEFDTYSEVLVSQTKSFENALPTGVLHFFGHPSLAWPGAIWTDVAELLLGWSSLPRGGGGAFGLQSAKSTPIQVGINQQGTLAERRRNRSIAAKGSVEGSVLRLNVVEGSQPQNSTPATHQQLGRSVGFGLGQLELMGVGMMSRSESP